MNKLLSNERASVLHRCQFSFFRASTTVLSTRRIFCSVPVLHAAMLLSNKSLMTDGYRKPFPPSRSICIQLRVENAASCMLSRSLTVCRKMFFDKLTRSKKNLAPCQTVDKAARTFAKGKTILQTPNKN